VAGSCEYGDEPSGSGAMGLAIFIYIHLSCKSVSCPITTKLFEVCKCTD
jgi:hypothetical protein